MFKIFLSLLIVVFVVVGQKPAFAAGQDLLSSVALPEQLYEEMVEAGMGKWEFLSAERGTKLTAGRPVMCESCGNPFFSQPNAQNNNCSTCAHPVTAATKRFVTPKQVMPDGRLRIFTPVAPQATGTLNPQARATYAAIAEMIPELQPCGCGRLNNPTLGNNSCWGCGADIDRSNIQPARQAKTTIVADEQMPVTRAEQRVQQQQPRPRTMRGPVTTGPVVADVVPSTRRINPRLVKTAMVGGVATVAVAAVAIGIGYVMTGDDVHISRGTVEFINSEEVRITVPGFPQPLVLKYDSDPQFDSDIYTKTTLQMYQGVDMVDVWWSREEGVIQILPIDLFSVTGGTNE